MRIAAKTDGIQGLKASGRETGGDTSEFRVYGAGKRGRTYASVAGFFWDQTKRWRAQCVPTGVLFRLDCNFAQVDLPLCRVQLSDHPKLQDCRWRVNSDG